MSFLSVGTLLLIPDAGATNIQPTYLACEPGLPSKPASACGGGWTITHAPSPGSPRFSSLIGFIDQTQSGPTNPVWLTCDTWIPVPRAQPVCNGRWYARTAPNNQYDSFIGYVHTFRDPGTTAAYFACQPNPPVPKAPTSCSNMWYVTTDPNAFLASFIGFVYIDPPVDQYALYPKYYIGSIIYVPPGQGPSSIMYGSGTVIGTTVSTTDSWTQQDSLGISFGNGTTITIGDTFGGSTTKSTDVRQMISSDITYRGPATNSINHDYDQIVLFLGLVVRAEIDWQGNITWSMDFSQMVARGHPSGGYAIPVGCLRSNSTLSAADCTPFWNLLSQNDIQPSDYPTILAVHPMADPNAPQSPDPDRYVPLDAFQFVPNPTSSTQRYSVNNSTTQTNSKTKTKSFSVGVSVEGGKDTTPLLKGSRTLTFTHQSTTSNVTGSNNSSALTLTLPAAGYTGPSVVFVYMDTIYKTFMFSFTQ